MSDHPHPSIDILDEVGRGDFATVFRAYDRNLARYIAVKELHEDLRGDARQFQQFCAEARFLASLRHDNIVQVYGLDPERGWITMELMRGSLDGEIRAAGLTPDLVRGVLRQCLEGLKALHARNKLHGAVKPANLLIDDAGRIKLSDSVGMAPDGEFRRPRGGWKYMPPELCSPGFGTTGPTLDLYGLGFTALELLKGPGFDALFKGVGQHPDAAEAEWMRWHGSTTERLPAAATLVPGLPADLAAVIDRLLIKEVAGRFPDAASALQALDSRPIPLFNPPTDPEPERGQTREPERRKAGTAEPVSTVLANERKASNPEDVKGDPEPEKRDRGTVTNSQSRRQPPPNSSLKDRINERLKNPIIMALLCLVILLVPAAFVVNDLFPDRPAPKRTTKTSPPKPPKPTPKEPVETEPSEAELAARAEAKRKQEEQAALAAAAERKRKDAELAEAERKRREAESAVPKPAEGAVAQNSDADKDPRPTADGVGALDGAAPAAKLPPGAIRALKGHTGSVTALAFTADGGRLASASVDRTVRVWDVAGRKTEPLRTFRAGQPVHGVAISTDGRRLASAAEDGVRFWDLETGESLATPKGGRFAYAATFLPRTNDRVLTAHKDRSVRLWDVDSGEEAIAPFLRHRANVLCLAASPDGRRSASGDADRVIRLWDVQTGEPVRLPGRAEEGGDLVLLGHEDFVFAVAFAPDGQSLLSAGADGMIRHWDLATGRERRQFANLDGSIFGLAYAPYDRALSAGPDATLRLWDVRSGKLVDQLPGQPAALRSVALGPDGTTAASGAQDGSLYLWSLARRP